MSEPTTDDFPPSPAGRRYIESQLSDIKAKLDVYIAGMAGWRDGVDRRLADHDLMHRQTTTTLVEVQQRLAAQDAIEKVQAAEKPARPSGWAIAAVLTAAASIVVNIVLVLSLRGG